MAKSSTPLMAMLAAVVLMLALTASAETILEQLTADGQYTQFLDFASQYGLNETILANTTTTFTVFAPTDAALQALTPDQLAQFTAGGAASILYLVLDGKVQRSDLHTNDLRATLAGTTFVVGNYPAAQNNLFTFNGIPIDPTVADVSNGLIFPLNTTVPLLPTNYMTGAIASGTIGNVAVSVFAAAVARLPLIAERLNTSGPYTLFVMSDAAISAVLPDAALANDEFMTQLLLLHISSGAWFSSAINATLQGSASFELTSLNTKPLSVAVNATDDGGVALNNGQARIVATDATQINGVIHVIDGVLLFKPSELLAALKGFSNLTAHLSTAGLLAQLDAGSNFTLFAPTDDAFAALSSAQQNALVSSPAATKELLSYHVVSEPVKTLDISLPIISKPTLQGGQINLGMYSSGAYFVGSAELDYDTVDLPVAGGSYLQALDGVIHNVGSEPVSAFFTPSTPLLYTSSDKFTTFLALAANTDLNQLLNGSLNSFVTVFAPSNAAFASLDTAVVSFLIANPDVAIYLLGFHVSEGAPYSLSFDFSTTPSPLVAVSGGDFYVEQPVEGTLRVQNTSTTRSVDWIGANGAVHVLDSVLVPPARISVALVFNNLTTFATLLRNTSLPSLIDPGSYTLIAPTNAAFASLDPAVIDRLHTDSDFLLAFLQFNSVIGDHPYDTLVSSTSAILLPNIANSVVRFDTSDTTVFAQGARLSSAPIQPTSGIILIVDKVLLPPTGDLLAVLETLNSTSAVGAVLGNTTLQGALSSPTANLTAFVPSNAAFETIPSQVRGVFAGSLLSKILAHHIVPDQLVYGALLPDFINKSFTTLQGDTIGLAFANSEFVITPDNAKVVSLDAAPASNGIVHLIDTVLLPVLNTFDVLQWDSYVTFASKLLQTNQSALLETAPIVTVFAPSDLAFSKLTPQELADFNDLTFASDAFDYMILTQQFNASDATDGQQLQDDGLILFVNKIGNKVYVNGKALDLAPAVTSNGVIYGMDDVVFLPTNTVNDVLAVLTPQFSDLAQLVGLNTTLASSTDVFTVFAPTDDALAALPADVVAGVYPALLTKILQHHVVPSTVLFDVVIQASFGRQFTTLTGENITFAAGAAPGDAVLNPGTCAISALDSLNVNLANNGVVQLLAEVSLPAFDVLDQIQYNGFQSFAEGLATVALDQPVATSPAVTAFAPSDVAFANLTAAQQAQLADPAYLKLVLQTHLLPIVLPPSQFVDSTYVQSIASGVGSKLILNHYEGQDYVNGIKVNSAISGTNGIVFGLDEVIFPVNVSLFGAISQLPSDLSTFVSKVQLGNLEGLLSNTDRIYTVFAPSNAAFAAFEHDSRLDNADFVSKLIQSHMVSSALYAPGITNGKSVLTVGGTQVVLHTNGTNIFFDTALAYKINLPAANGVLYVIDKVIITPAPHDSGSSSNSGAIAAGVLVPLFVIGAAVGYYLYRRRQARYQYSPLI
ncbi:hypothetical protein CAOG_05955 [Capsaspora owczarzaki ATCC 30864]|nr:hypothetical protein CAOG_05955 [Capsaspora owczarzaki ATCC 30864]|eukprot:XP_004345545.1 hypothetical protein CAOG_05955 [Capsaspora owczarzaki ATCC 30864]